MKKTILFLIMAISLQLNAQEKFTYSEKGLTDYVVLEIDSLNQTELYNKTIDWVKENYVNPDEVIKAKFENEKIRFNGFKSSAFLMKVLATPFFLDARYSIEISFKDGKLKFDPVSLDHYSAPSQYSPGGWSAITLETNSWLFKESGKLKKITETYPERIEDIFNGLILSLNDYLLKSSGAIKDVEKDW